MDSENKEQEYPSACCCDEAEYTEESPYPNADSNGSILENMKAYDGGEADRRIKAFYKEQKHNQRRMLAQEKREDRYTEENRRQKELHAQKKELEATERSEQLLKGVDRPKLTGYDWFKSIGSPKYVVAPMVDQSELAFRMLTRKHGATLVYTQMFNSNNFWESPEYRRSNFDTCYNDRPLIVQFCGHDPEKLLKSARFVEDKCDAVDINLGCPQAIAKRGRYGAYLMEELDLLTDMVSTLAKNLKVPVTCKTRIYHDFERSVKLCETLVNAGASLLTIHGRTREEKGQAIRAADWETLRRLKEHFRGRVPIIANGGISSMDDVERCLAQTGCDGVMTSEAILENPALFARNVTFADPRTSVSPTVPGYRTPIKFMTQVDVAEEYLDMCCLYPVWHFRTMRSHVQKFLHRYLTKHTDIRDMVSVSISVDEFRMCISKIREVLAKEAEEQTDEIESVSKSPLVPSAVERSYEDKTWYLRHRTGVTHIHSGRVTSASEVYAKLNQRNSIFNSDQEDGDYGFSIFSN